MNEEKLKGDDALFDRLKGWFLQDYDKQSEWRRSAREDFAFTSGDQLSDDDKSILRDANRPIIIMNRIEPVIDSVAGSEVANRQEIQFIPRSQGDVSVNEVLTSAAKWFRDQCDAEDEESDAFRDTIVCGMGWTETRLDFEDDPTGSPVVERTDPLEMVWDSTAKKRNLVDMRRVFHIRRNIPLDEAKALCPGDFEDSDYNATWVDDDPESERKEAHHTDNKSYDSGDGDDGQEEKTVTLVRAQWCEREPAFVMQDPADQSGKNILTVSEDEYEQMQAKMQMLGMPELPATKTMRKVYKQAFIGREILEVQAAPCKDHFSFKCITGKRDRNKNTFYGLVRAMKDPQRWANKWMSQTMHIMNTTAKGGIAVEEGQFFTSDAEGEQSWAKSDVVTKLKPGALSGTNPKFIQKPVSQFPQSSFELMQFAISSIRDTSGVNVELLGMANQSGQAAELDRQRKQSAMTILQSLFDSLRRYRKEQGRLLLYLIEHYLSDGRLIKIVGEEGAKYVPLIKQPGVATYDVIVDEAPTSANQKEATWSLLQQILPVIGKMLPPETWIALLKYSPLPTSAQDDIRQSLQQAQSQPNPEQEQNQAEADRKQAETKAKIDQGNALTQAKIQNMQAEQGAKWQLEAHKAAVGTTLKVAERQEAKEDSAVLQAVSGLQRDMQALVQSIQALVAPQTSGQPG